VPNFGYPLLEIYAPIYSFESKKIIAVGEFYEDGTDFFNYLRTSKRRTWGIVGVTTASIMALLFLVVRRASGVIQTQRAILGSQLASARVMAEQNARLRNAADRARMDASNSNEHLLNRIGADLHDGPIQLLSLLILKLGDRSANRAAGSPMSYAKADVSADHPNPAGLAGQVLTELRELATGLVLPELESMSLEATIRLAVESHERTTGTVVDAEYAGLPERIAQPLKVCLFRVVQEGLNNAFRHAAGRGQRVLASADAEVITVIVSDKGPGIKRGAESSAQAKSLGLHGIRHRVEAFGGTVELRPRRGAGVELVVTIPLESNGGQ
jgi:signal transduction histidine kinase